MCLLTCVFFRSRTTQTNVGRPYGREGERPNERQGERKNEGQNNSNRGNAIISNSDGNNSNSSSRYDLGPGHDF